MKLICKNTIASESNIIKLRNLIDENLEIFDPKSIKSLSVGFSFVIFILKEITQFVIEKTSNGIFLQNLRLIYKKMKKDIFQKNYCIEILQEYSKEHSL